VIEFTPQMTSGALALLHALTNPREVEAQLLRIQNAQAALGDVEGQKRTNATTRVELEARATALDKDRAEFQKRLTGLKSAKRRYAKAAECWPRRKSACNTNGMILRGAKTLLLCERPM
jgi:hypothetical protein